MVRIRVFFTGCLTSSVAEKTEFVKFHFSGFLGICLAVSEFFDCGFLAKGGCSFFRIKIPDVFVGSSSGCGKASAFRSGLWEILVVIFIIYKLFYLSQ